MMTIDPVTSMTMTTDHWPAASMSNTTSTRTTCEHNHYNPAHCNNTVIMMTNYQNGLHDHHHNDQHTMMMGTTTTMNTSTKNMMTITTSGEFHDIKV